MKPHIKKYILPRIKHVSLGLLMGMLLPGTTLVYAVDQKLKPIADGTQIARGNQSDGTSRRLHAEYNESQSIYVSGRRIVMKFDTAFASSYQLRNAKLYMFGGNGGANALTGIYHYTDDNWTESNIPYVSNSQCRYLGQKTISNSLTADYIGTSQWHAYDIGNSILSSDHDGKLSLVLRNHTYSSNYKSSVSFVSRNAVTWDGSKGKEPYLAFEIWNPNFEISSFDMTAGLGPWSPSGPGVAEVISDPNDPMNSLAQMTAGSPISISQAIDTPEDPFYIMVGYEFKTTEGFLDVSLTHRDGTKTMIGHLDAPGELDPGMKSKAFRVTDPSLLAADNVTLDLTFDGVTGSRIWVDEVKFSTVPEPSDILLFGLGLLMIGRRRRR